MGFILPIILIFSVILSFIQHFILLDFNSLSFKFDEWQIYRLILGFIFYFLLLVILTWLIKFLLMKNMVYKIMIIILLGLLFYSYFNWFNDSYFEHYRVTSVGSLSGPVLQSGFPFVVFEDNRLDITVPPTSPEPQKSYLNRNSNYVFWFVIGLAFWAVIEYIMRRNQKKLINRETTKQL